MAIGRSRTSYRTRIALNVKGLPYRQVAVILLTGAQKDETFLKLNPQGLVPALVAGEAVFTQSSAILSGWKKIIPSRRCCHSTSAIRPSFGRWP